MNVHISGLTATRNVLTKNLESMHKNIASSDRGELLYVFPRSAAYPMNKEKAGPSVTRLDLPPVFPRRTEDVRDAPFFPSLFNPCVIIKIV